MRAENDLGKDKISRLVLRIAIPSMLAQFVSVFYSIVDRIFVGNIPEVGNLALAGVGICGPILTMIGSVAFLVGTGGTPLMGMRMGEGNMKQAERILANAFVMLTVFAVILTTVMLAIREPMLKLFGASGETYTYAESYFKVYICGTVFALLSTGMNQFIISQGFAQMGMFSVMIGAVLNIILDPIFIFVLDMGVQGAALATIISQAVSAAFVLKFLFSKNPPVRITFNGYKLRTMGKILKIGMTPFLIIGFDNVMIIAMNSLLQKYGGATQGDMLITCNTIVQSFMLLVTMPLGGISGGTQGILSYNFGAGRSDRVLKAEKNIMFLCAAYTTLMFIVARTLDGNFVSMFTSDTVIMEEACRAIQICTMALPLLGIQYAIVDGFTGMGQVQVSLPLSAFRKIVYFVSIFILPVFGEVKVIFYAEPTSDIIGPIVSIIVVLLVFKKILKKREKEIGNHDGTILL
ncbi:MAG: MATE family efflux transporter [Schaedlerella sp.]|nr:MATE family efflux transporter [Schaedlerella sp.]